MKIEIKLITDDPFPVVLSYDAEKEEVFFDTGIRRYMIHAALMGYSKHSEVANQFKEVLDMVEKLKQELFRFVKIWEGGE